MPPPSSAPSPPAATATPKPQTPPSANPSPSPTPKPSISVSSTSSPPTTQPSSTPSTTAAKLPASTARIQTLNLAAFTLVDLQPSFRERFLTRLTDPNLAVLLLIGGVLLIYLEFHVPGTIIPGALGTFFVLLALFGLDLLPVSHTAVALVLAGLVLLLVEFKLPSHGVLAFCGAIALVLGLATLTTAPISEQRVHLSTALSTGLAFAAISFLLAWSALRARRNKILLGPQAMVGKLAIARTPLSPSGQVEIRGEIWQATLRNPADTIPTGHSVLILEAEGLHLLVAPTS